MDSTERAVSIRDAFLTTRHEWQIATSTDRTCVAHLKRYLPHIPEALWGELLKEGGGYRNGRRIQFEDELCPPCTLEYFEPRGDLSTFFSELPSCSQSDVLFADDDLAVVVKPAGIATTPVRDLPNHNVMVKFSKVLGRPVHPPSRLDVAVCGVMLLSLSDRMNRYCQKAHERAWFVKEYVAEVEGNPSWVSEEVTLPIGRDPVFSLLRTTQACAGEMQEARTVFSKEGTHFDSKRGCEVSFLRAQPITGRTHQIRVHLQAIGYPIVGDPFYGTPDEGLRLVSRSLGLFHPYSQRQMTWSMPLYMIPKWLSRFEG